MWDVENDTRDGGAQRIEDRIKGVRTKIINTIEGRRRSQEAQMIAEVSAGHKTTEMFRQMAQTLTGRVETKRPRGGLLSPLLSRLKKRKG